MLALKDFTLITITHNLDAALLSKYDEIIYMEEGTIVEAGSFTDLIEKQAAFYAYFNQTANEPLLANC